MEMNPSAGMNPGKPARTAPSTQKLQMWASIMLTLAAIVVIALLISQR
jgi:hypothetical protein